jgi:hypothetical protein
MTRKERLLGQRVAPTCRVRKGGLALRTGALEDLSLALGSGSLYPGRQGHTRDSEMVSTWETTGHVCQKSWKCLLWHKEC